VARNADPARTKSSPADQQVSGQGSHPHVESIGVLKDLKSDCCENTMQKLNPDVFFLVSSLVVLHAWVLPIH
jgi:hypothetical protein